MKILRLFLILIISCRGTIAKAEYRVFLLKFSQPAASPGQPEVFRLLESNLDPEQYRRYYPVYPNEKISYIDTWRCYGRTGDFQSYCKSPRAPAQSPDGAQPQDQILQRPR